MMINLNSSKGIKLYFHWRILNRIRIGNKVTLVSTKITLLSLWHFIIRILRVEIFIVWLTTTTIKISLMNII